MAEVHTDISGDTHTGGVAAAFNLVPDDRFDPEEIRRRQVLTAIDGLFGIIGASVIDWDAQYVRAYDAKEASVDDRTTPLWEAYEITGRYGTEEGVVETTRYVRSDQMPQWFSGLVLAVVDQQAAMNTYGSVGDREVAGHFGKKVDPERGHREVIFTAGAQDTSFETWAGDRNAHKPEYSAEAA